MSEGQPAPRLGGVEPAVAPRATAPNGQGAAGAPRLLETTVSPFHCLYQDALHFHGQSALAASRSESEASRLARASLVLYLAAAEALVHQAAVELGRPELAPLVADPSRPRPPIDAWRLLPAIVADAPAGPHDPNAPPWPQLAELLALRASWAYPGPADDRRAYYVPRPGGAYDPIEPHQVPSALGPAAPRLFFPRTGLPRDPYALRPKHLDTARGVVDSAIDALDRRLGGSLTRDGRHRKEPIRPIEPVG